MKISCELVFQREQCRDGTGRKGERGERGEQQESEDSSLKRFKSSWLDESVDGTKVRLWCRPDPTNPQRAQCLLCPDTTFTIGEGFTAISRVASLIWRKTGQKSVKISKML